MGLKGFLFFLGINNVWAYEVVLDSGQEPFTKYFHTVSDAAQFCLNYSKFSLSVEYH